MRTVEFDDITYMRVPVGTYAGREENGKTNKKSVVQVQT